jgi:hypothetical protein
MSAELTVGTRIYRPASFVGQGKDQRLVLHTPALERFEDGTVMLRAVPDGDRSPHWQVIPWDAGGGRVLVCDEAIPEDWTYFEVLFADVNFVAVSPVAGEAEELVRNRANVR